MARYLGYGGTTFPAQGSTQIQEYVKHFESDVSFLDLEADINAWLDQISTDSVVNRPAIRQVSFHIAEKMLTPSEGVIFYYAQVHYILIGDADDSANV